MKSRPILFSAPMVRALLDGRKTQTRRIVKPQPPVEADALRDVPRENRWWAAYATRDDFGTEYRPLGSDQQHDWRCPYGVPGDLLWVRETWGVGSRPHPVRGWVEGIEYRADETPGECLDVREVEPPAGVDLDSFRPGWHPSIHMPRWASRITLRITDVRVERLLDISEGDILAEGVTVDRVAEWTNTPWSLMPTLDHAWRVLWDHINGHRAYEANPWVWAVAFERVTDSQGERHGA